MKVYEEVKAIESELKSIRRHLHQYPEIGMDLPETADYVEQKLQEYGYKTTRYGTYGVSAIVGTGEGCMLLRADMDALPMEEESGLSFQSTYHQRAHTCGHDLHTAMLLGAAKILKEHEAELPRSVKFMFQPGEEVGLGAKDMIAHGLLTNPTVDCAFALHVYSQAPCGVLASTSGTVSSNSTLFDIKLTGKGCHGSTPYEGNDPMRVAVQVYQAIQTIISQEIRPDDIAVASIGSIQAGETNNIIPNTASMKGTIRTFDDRIDAYICKRIVEVSNAIANAYHASAEVTFPANLPSVHNHEDLHHQFLTSLKEVVDPRYVIASNERNFGSEDFGFISREVPSLMIFVGAKASEPAYGQHHPKVLFHEDSLVSGCCAYVQSALTLFASETAKM